MDMVCAYICRLVSEESVAKLVRGFWRYFAWWYVIVFLWWRKDITFSEQMSRLWLWLGVWQTCR